MTYCLTPFTFRFYTTDALCRFSQSGTVDLPNFEHVPYFEHHVNKGVYKPTTYKLIHLVHKDVFRLVNEIKNLQS